MASLEGDVEFGEILLILVIFVFVGWLIYKGFASLGDFLKNFKLPSLGDLFNFHPNTGKSGGTVNGTGAAAAGSQPGSCGKADANIKLEINRGGPCGVMTPATAAGADSNCGGAQANCCAGSCC